MPDENFLSQVPAASALFLREEEVRRGIEFLFFAHGALWRAIDARLAEHDLGRAHYRALYFIARQPGLAISDLLALLDEMGAPTLQVVHSLGDSPDHSMLADFHNGLVWNTLWAQAMAKHLHDVVKVPVAPISDEEVVRFIRSQTDAPSGASVRATGS